MPRPLYPRVKPPGTHGAWGWAGGGGGQGRSGREQKISPQPWLDPWTIQPVASRYTDWAIPAHKFAEFQVHYIRLRQ
jgi:hypothetical protein